MTEESEAPAAGSRKHTPAPDLAEELEDLRVAWCLNICDAPSPDDEIRPLHTSECRKARAALRAAGLEASNASARSAHKSVSERGASLKGK